MPKTPASGFGAAPSGDGTGVQTTRVIVFDVNETLSDLAPMAQRFASVDLPPHLAQTWFAQVLRDGFALAATGDSASFAAIAAGALHTVLATHAPHRDSEAAVQHVLEGFRSLAVHPDVPEGVRVLEDAGLRLVTLSNGAPDVAEALLTRAGVRERFERLLSVEDAGLWKPALASYAYAARACEVSPADMMLVAVHPWDVHGAARAGLRTAWVTRDEGAAYPSYFTAPDLIVTGLDDLAHQLTAQG